MGKTVLITGSSEGIGFAAANLLAAGGAEVILTARTEAELQKAAELIRVETPNAKLKYYTVEFASQKAIRQLAANIRKDYKKLDVLINNVGGVFSDFETTEDGLEKTIATNYFAGFLLTKLLLDLLEASKAARIINVTSALHEQGTINFPSFTEQAEPEFKTRVQFLLKSPLTVKMLTLFMGDFLMRSYAQSKLAVLLFTQELAMRLSNSSITVNCVHPGFVRTGIAANTKWHSALFWNLISKFGARKVEEAAQDLVYLATSENVEQLTGKYIEYGKVIPVVTDEKLQRELWLYSEKLCLKTDSGIE